MKNNNKLVTSLTVALILASCSSDMMTPQIIRDDSSGDKFEVTVLDQHHNTIQCDTLMNFQIGLLDTLSEGVYAIVVKNVSTSTYEFKTYYVGSDSWKRNGISSYHNTVVRDFYCAITSKGMPISGYCEQITTVLKFDLDSDQRLNGALWSSCDFSIQLSESKSVSTVNNECAESMKSAYQGINYFKMIFENDSSMRILTSEDSIVFASDSITTRWTK